MLFLVSKVPLYVLKALPPLNSAARTFGRNTDGDAKGFGRHKGLSLFNVSRAINARCKPRMICTSGALSTCLLPFVCTLQTTTEQVEKETNVQLAVKDDESLFTGLSCPISGHLSSRETKACTVLSIYMVIHKVGCLEAEPHWCPTHDHP